MAEERRDVDYTRKVVGQLEERSQGASQTLSNINAAQAAAQAAQTQSSNSQSGSTNERR